ncbi:MAG: 3'-5' exonuclease [Treponema sp.]|jgi:DNA polymerase III epsilon subunit-like protein|nr:3'-5' exonuclease [Treponema sp.]
MHTRLFWVDTETTGFDSRNHFAFQIAYLIEENGSVLAQRSLEMRPDHCGPYGPFEFSKRAEEVHGWTRERILGLPPESERYPELLADLAEFGQNRLTVAGYNVEFDIRFLKGLFYRNKAADSKHVCGDYYRYFDGLPFDVLQFAQGCRIAGLLPLPSLRLETICAHFGLDLFGAHSAMKDILNTKAVFEKLRGLGNGGLT